MGVEVHDSTNWLLLFFSSWALCVGLADIIGRRKHYMWAGGLGLIFGPFGVLVATMLPEVWLTCPGCGELVNHNAQRCWRCKGSRVHHFEDGRSPVVLLEGQEPPKAVRYPWLQGPDRPEKRNP